uniref:Pentatricopeptide repeat-containing protein n=1 Tax=Daucus carota subsp. sativus TaxID=79200 RepID=A0A166E514_DAUCS
MMFEMFVPDSTTFTGLFKLCIEINDIEIGRQLHCLVIKAGLCEDCFVSSVLVDLYAKFGVVEDARKVFDFVLDRDVVLWNVMVSCYALNGLGGEAFRVFRSMEFNGVKGDDFTITSLINVCSSCASCELGRLIHGLLIRQGFDLDVVIASALIDMYVKTENICDALKVFQAMNLRNSISWTTLIVGYGRHGDGNKATILLVKMLGEGLNPDELTLASVLSSCGNLSLFGETVQIHAYALKTAFSAFLSVGNALINSYSRSGNFASAYLSFISIIEPDLVSWTSMIGACAFHGLSGEDTLGAFIGACKVYGNLELEKWSTEQLIILEPNMSVSYTLMSNMYASAGSWKDVSRVRKMMRENCHFKVPGSSWTDIAGEVHTFFSSDRTHPQMLEMNAALVTLFGLMKNKEHRPSIDLLH